MCPGEDGASSRGERFESLLATLECGSGDLPDVVRELPDALARQGLGDLCRPSSPLPRARRALIQSGRVPDLVRLLEHLRRRAAAEELHETVYLLRTLLYNACWHVGRTRDCDRLRADLADRSESRFHPLFQVFSAYERNTRGFYGHSQELLESVSLEDEGRRAAVEAYLGVALDFAVLTWQIWNRSETLDYVGLPAELDRATALVGEAGRDAPKSTSLLSLALGIFFLVQGASAQAHRWLEKALRLAVGEGSVWRPRVLSGLVLSQYRLGDREDSERRLDECLDLLDAHFGPSGWMLRVVEGLRLHDRSEEASDLLDQVARSAREKSEVGYQIWSRISRWKVATATPSPSEVRRVFEKAAARDMRRACTSIVELGLLESERESGATRRAT